LEGLRLKIVDVFYGHWEYFKEIWDTLWPFGTFCVYLVHFSGFGIMHHEKSGNPAHKQKNASLTFLLCVHTIGFNVYSLCDHCDITSLAEET
jgi:hypothetical protein